MSDALFQAMRELIRESVAHEVLKAETRLKEFVTREAPKVIAGPAPKDGKDGRGIQRVWISTVGELCIHYTDGDQEILGLVRGADGKDGQSGKDGIGERGERGADGINGKDGAPSTVAGPKGDPGEPGTDGIATEAEIDAKIEARFADVQTRSLADYHKRTYEHGAAYKRGDLAVWDGTTWLAMSDTKAVPGTSPDWQQFAKKGRDGRDRK